jgi:hypothetical protein
MVLQTPATEPGGAESPLSAGGSCAVVLTATLYLGEPDFHGAMFKCFPPHYGAIRAIHGVQRCNPALARFSIAARRLQRA